eukprot:2445313-Pyramimonas_sp.AAC.1
MGGSWGVPTSQPASKPPPTPSPAAAPPPDSRSDWKERAAEGRRSGEFAQGRGKIARAGFAGRKNIPCEGLVS